MNIFEQEAILDGFFKKCVAKHPNNAQYTASIISTPIKVRDNGVISEVYVGKFFSLLSGTVMVVSDFSAYGGSSQAESIATNIKNLNTGEIQTVYSYTAGDEDEITVSAMTSYEISVLVGTGNTSPNITLDVLNLSFDVVTDQSKYIVTREGR